MSKSDDIKITYLAMLARIGCVDGNLDDIEEGYIDRIAERLNISASVAKLVKESPLHFCKQLPDTYGQRIEFFYNLLFMMGINNEISESEKSLVKQIGFNLCFNPMLMDDLINIITSYLGKDVPVDEVIQAVIKYQN